MVVGYESSGLWSVIGALLVYRLQFYQWLPAQNHRSCEVSVLWDQNFSIIGPSAVASSRGRSLAQRGASRARDFVCQLPKWLRVPPKCRATWKCSCQGKIHSDPSGNIDGFRIWIRAVSGKTLALSPPCLELQTSYKSLTACKGNNVFMSELRRVQYLEQQLCLLVQHLRSVEPVPCAQILYFHTIPRIKH